MREKTFRVVVTFRTTTDAMAFEAACGRKKVPGRLIPVPSELSADCGMCWSAPAEAAALLEAAIGAEGLKIDRIYTVLL